MFIESDAAAQADDIIRLAEEFGPFKRGFVEAVIRNLRALRHEMDDEEVDCE
jgi:hypothetical protein